MKLAYPETWREYRGLVIKPDDLLGNVQRAQKFDNDYRMRRITGDRQSNTAWLITPQTVNAYYNPALNEMVVPAALLQPPLFDAGGDEAINFGGIGAVIGHEISHGFDDRGRLYDADGTVRDWWTARDAQEFERRAQQIVEQFSAYTPAGGLRVNGGLTRSENLGDLCGLSVAYRAYRIALEGRPAPIVDGLTGNQRFFLAWARAWRGAVRPEFLRQWLLTIPYAPPAYRANGAVGNIPAFYDAFGVKPGDRLYRDPAVRVTIW
jgi:putative endopeptidase